MAGCGSHKKGYKSGGPVSRGGPAKIKNKRREEMNEGIEAAVSEAMSPPDKRSLRQKLEDKASNFGRKYQDKMSEFRLTGDIQKYKKGGKVFPDLNGDGEVTRADILKGRGVEGFYRGGDVRVNSKRGKCY